VDASLQIPTHFSTHPLCLLTNIYRLSQAIFSVSRQFYSDLYYSTKYSIYVYISTTPSSSSSKLCIVFPLDFPMCTSPCIKTGLVFSVLKSWRNHLLSCPLVLRYVQRYSVFKNLFHFRISVYFKRMCVAFSSLQMDTVLFLYLTLYFSISRLLV